MNIGGGAGAVLGTVSGISNLAKSLSARLGGSIGSYFDQLRPASFGGKAFVSLAAEGTFGRRNALHEYPKRDDPWAEDMGRAARRFQVTGYLVGDDVIEQRDILIQIVEQENGAELVHPTYGRRQVNVMEFRVIERWDKARYFELQFDFVESGNRIFPTADNATTSLVASAVNALGLASAADFATRVLDTLSYGAAVVGMAVNTALTWYTNAKNIVGDARNLVRLVFNLPGNFGRFAGSATVPTFSKYPGAPARASSLTVEDLIEQATRARTAVSTAAGALSTAAASLSSSSTSTFAAAAQGVATAVLAAAPAPSDAIRLLTSLASFQPSTPTTASAIGTGMATMQSACGDLFRRAAIGSAAIAASQYQPTSADDATAVRNALTTLIDSEIEVAGNQGEDQTYGALRSLRAAVVQDLNKRGAGLASIRTFNMKAGLPALALAHRLYRDAGRADELVAQVNPVHPAFMPLSFRALSS
ncbi:DNA circularization protein [Burkholderia vietnamiensis]|uniref:DNA circularization protein n=1 Tax=Burkholderia vietnamiensis TaxID=60552 RepID=UPI00264E2EE6|nr:DNA circularization N-terminal domain-containing protein [Burkholderia vietnamiensis]MDN7814916.1 DNA circularization N-terminal domain-containing protein [Burkholderia vietnamiensis]